MKTKQIFSWSMALTLILCFTWTSPQVHAASLPALIDFDSDDPDSAPTIGGVDQPTSLFTSPGTSVLVQSNSNGIDTQPVELNDNGTGDFINVGYGFSPPVSSDILRVEATVSFNRLFDGFFLQTGVTETLAVVNRLIARSNGEIQAENERTSDPRTILGDYSPNQPFRVRMDIDIVSGFWSFALDDEMNGFSDDLIITDLEFVNDISVLPHVGAVNASLSVFPTLPLGIPTTVAYDDISISIVTDLEVIVTIDIKPSSYPNSINLKSKGKVPVAILTTDDFDAYDVDPDTCSFADADPLRWKMEDVDHDGVYDLIIHFKTRELDLTKDSTEATLECETDGGMWIKGTDSVNIVPKGKGHSKKSKKKKKK